MTRNITITLLLSWLVPGVAQSPPPAPPAPASAVDPAAAPPSKPEIKRTPFAQAAFAAWQKQDYPAVFAAATSGAAKGEAECIFFLGRLCEQGWGTKADAVKARGYYLAASEAGNTEATHHYARCLEAGIGGKADPDKADFLRQQAAEAGFAPSQSGMGLAELRGIRRPVNLEAARAWFEKSAAKNDPEGMYFLSTFYQGGLGGTQKDLPKAIELCLKAANAGNLEAVNQVGLLYKHGMGFREDKAAAAGWFNLAAEYGYAPAMTNLGQCYQNGEGVKKNLPVAARLFTDAAKQNEKVAFYCLAEAYEKGEGVEKNLVNAYLHYARSAHLGFSHAEKPRDAVKAKLTPEERKRAEKRAAEAPQESRK